MKRMLIPVLGIAASLPSTAVAQFMPDEKKLPVHAAGGEPSRVGYAQRAASERSIYDNVPDTHDLTPGVTYYVNQTFPADFPFTAMLGGLACGEAITTSLPYAGRGASGPVPSYLETIHFGVGHAFNLNVDVYHAFYDDISWWESGACKMDLRRGYLGGFVVQNIPTSGPYAMVSMSGLSQFSIPISDNYVVYEQLIAIAGSGGIGDPDALTVFAGDSSGCADGANFIGHSDGWFYTDIDASGGIDAHELGFHFGGAPFVANIYLSLSVLYCPADVDFSGFVDIDDQTFFNDHFISGC